MYFIDAEKPFITPSAGPDRPATESDQPPNQPFDQEAGQTAERTNPFARVAEVVHYVAPVAVEAFAQHTGVENPVPQDLTVGQEFGVHALKFAMHHLEQRAQARR